MRVQGCGDPVLRDSERATCGHVAQQRDEPVVAVEYKPTAAAEIEDGQREPAARSRKDALEVRHLLTLCWGQNSSVACDVDGPQRAGVGGPVVGGPS